jgi:hypothetical protein
MWTWRLPWQIESSGANRSRFTEQTVLKLGKAVEAESASVDELERLVGDSAKLGRTSRNGYGCAITLTSVSTVTAPKREPD